MDIDRRGRRRKPDQGRGLRPLFPLLPERWVSKALRVAMSEHDWSKFGTLVEAASTQEPTHARACGLALSQLMEHLPTPASSPASLDWMDWERRKTLRLLRSAV
jgi:hypothetical protein